MFMVSKGGSCQPRQPVSLSVSFKGTDVEGCCSVFQGNKREESFLGGCRSKSQELMNAIKLSLS